MDALSTSNILATMGTFAGDLFALAACGSALLAFVFSLFSREYLRFWFASAFAGAACLAGMATRSATTVPVGTPYGVLQLSPLIIGLLLGAAGCFLFAALAMRSIVSR